MFASYNRTHAYRSDIDLYFQSLKVQLMNYHVDETMT